MKNKTNGSVATATPNNVNYTVTDENAQQIKQFFDLIWPNGGENTYFCHLANGCTSLWNAKARINELIERHRDKDIYFGVATASQLGNERQRVKLTGPIFPHQIAVFFADFDASDYDAKLKEAKEKGKQHDPSRGKSLAWQALDAAQADTIPASIIIDSGGGYHAYWLLEQPITITDENRADISKLMAGLVNRWKSDKAVKDLARVLRVPNSYNHKPHYANGPLLCKIVKLNNTISYNLDKIHALVKPAQLKLTEQSNKRSRKRRKIQPVKEWAYELLVAKQCFDSLDPDSDEWYNIVLAMAGTFAGSPVEQQLVKALDEWSARDRSVKMGFELELPEELEKEAMAYAALKQVDISNLIVTSQSEFLARQRSHELKTWLAEGPSEWPAQWETEELDELLAGISEDNLHKEIDFGPPVGAEVW